jgi:hypothetical protein
VPWLHLFGKRALKIGHRQAILRLGAAHHDTVGQIK